LIGSTRRTARSAARRRDAGAPPAVEPVVFAER
jgi:hypothetical protein